MKKELQQHDRQKVARVVQKACLQAAQIGYEDARMDGLCHEGAWEIALDAIRNLDVSQLIQEMKGA